MILKKLNTIVKTKNGFNAVFSTSSRPRFGYTMIADAVKVPEGAKNLLVFYTMNWYVDNDPTKEKRSEKIPVAIVRTHGINHNPHSGAHWVKASWIETPYNLTQRHAIEAVKKLLKTNPMVLLPHTHANTKVDIGEGNVIEDFTIYTFEMIEWGGEDDR